MHHSLVHRVCSSVFTCLSIVLSAALVLSQAPSVTGTIVVGATKITPKSVSAVGYTAPNGQLISVLISDKPADRKTFVELTKIGPGEKPVSGIFEGAWKSLHAENALAGFVFTIDADRRVLTTDVLVGGKDNMFSMASDDFVLELTSDRPRLKGRIRTKEPMVSLGSYHVGIDLAFDTAVAEHGK